MTHPLVPSTSDAQPVKIDQHYLQCPEGSQGRWREQQLPAGEGKTAFVSAQICEDISCTFSDCFFQRDFRAVIHYPEPMVLLVFGRQGVSDFCSDNVSFSCTVRPGDVWLIITDSASLRRYTRAGQHAAMTVVKYRLARLAKAYDNTQEQGLQPGNAWRLGHQQQCEPWLATLAENPMLSPANRLMAEARALELLGRWLTPDESEQAQVAPLDDLLRQQLQRSVQLLTSDLARPPSLEWLAAEVGMSHTRLNRCFKKHYGDTVFGWLRQYRLSRACRYLEDPQRSITQIAFACGFSSASHFSSTFKRERGCSPAQYRNQLPQG